MKTYILKFLIIFPSILVMSKWAHSQEITLDNPLLITNSDGNLKATPCLNVPFFIDSLIVNTKYQLAAGPDTIFIKGFDEGVFRPVRGKGVPCEIILDENVMIKERYPNIVGMVWSFENEDIVFQIGNTLYMPRKGSTISFTADGVELSGVRTSSIRRNQTESESARESVLPGAGEKSAQEPAKTVENDKLSESTVEAKPLAIQKSQSKEAVSPEKPAPQQVKTNEPSQMQTALSIRIIQTNETNGFYNFRIWNSQNWQYDDSRTSITIYSASGKTCQITKSYSEGKFGFFPIDGAGKYKMKINLGMRDDRNAIITKHLEKDITISANPTGFLGTIERTSGNFLYMQILNGIQYVPGQKIKVLSKDTNYKIVMATGYITNVNQHTCTIELQEIFGAVQNGDMLQL